MKIRSLAFLFSLSAFPVVAATVDLSTWGAQNYSPGAGNWVLQPGNTSVLQTLNGNPTVFLSDQSAIGTAIQGTIRVNTSSDNDFVGFVLGFSAGDFANAAADYLLIDWKQGNQAPATAGLAVSRVTGIAATADPFWAHTGAVSELARGATLGSTGWSENVNYVFSFAFSATNLQVSVNGVEQFNLNGSFSGGNFGFYNYSQSGVLYSGFTQDPWVPNNNAPDGGTTLALLGSKHAGLMFTRRGLKVRV